jgi:hypothetical protein
MMNRSEIRNKQEGGAYQSARKLSPPVAKTNPKERQNVSAWDFMNL